MRAISMWQPWATAAVRGSKRIETRGWATDYRGPLAIHASKRWVQYEMIGFLSNWCWCGALGLRMGCGMDDLRNVLPLGAIIGVVKVVDCRPTSEFTIGELRQRVHPEGGFSHTYDWTEGQMGDFSIGRYGWVLSDPIVLPEPIPEVGRQGFWNASHPILDELERLAA